MRPRIHLLALCLAAALSLHAAPPAAPDTAPPAAPLSAPSPLQERANHFLSLFNAGYQSLIAVREAAGWDASVDVTPAHDAAAEATSRSFAAFTGHPTVIAESRALLERRAELDPVTVLQLQRVLFNAAEAPMTNPALARARIAAETAQDSALNTFTFHLDDQALATNQLDERLLTCTDLAQRRALWEASKQSGPALKPGLIELQKLRNGVARELGYPDYFTLQFATYGLSAEEMLRLNDEFLRVLRPLYLQLHTWAKYELAKRYGQPVPKRIPAHWLANRWGQEWPGLVAAANLDAQFAQHPREWIAKTAEQFYIGLGFAPLPASFWQRSDLYPRAVDAPSHKSSHAFCYDVDLEGDVRGLLNIEANTDWFGTAHHEFGHAFYMLAYDRPGVPPLLRDSPVSGLHEGIAELGAYAARQAPYLQSLGLIPAGIAPDPIAFLLDDALNPTVPFMFFASGTMTHWEADLYAHDLPADQWNARWWQYVRDFQGIEPPEPRSEQWCDAATKTHINSVPCYYANYAIATVIRFQLQEHIAKRILHQPPQSCNYAGHTEVGDFLRTIMVKGATQDWRTVLREATGEELSTRAMVEYFEPLQRWLEAHNRGRQIGWE